MRFVIEGTRPAPRLPQWTLLVSSAAILLAFAHLHASVRHLASTQAAHQADGATGASSGGGGQPYTRRQLSPGTLGCEHSGYCSLGKTKTWRGDVATNAALRDMLAAVAFKKELIITSLNKPRGAWAELALNFVRSAHDLGLGHVVMFAAEGSICEALPAAFDDISCMWDSRPGASGTGVTHTAVFWAKRWEVTARALRMGYNVLIIDSDSMLHHDPYVFLKAPPLNKYTLLFQKDAPDGYFGGGINCGVMYWQNAHPSGPSVWSAVHHTDRTYRQREGVEAMQQVYPGWDPYNYTWDQGTWNDMLLSMDTGEPRYVAVVWVASPEWREQMDPEWALLRLDCKAYTQWPLEWVKITGISPGSDTPLCELASLRMPRPKSPEWWSSHGHLIYPPQRGPRAEAFMQLIRDASDLPYAELDEPWEPPNPAPPVEHGAFLPSFFASGYIFRGAHFFGPNSPPPQVVSHLVYVNTDGGTKDWKAYVFKGQNWWHWEVTEALNGGNVLGVQDPRLLMLAPGVHLLANTEEGFRDGVKQLAVLAEAMGRHPVLPPVPCDSAWVGGWLEPEERLKLFPNLTSWTQSYDAQQVLQFPDRQRPGSSYCHWNRDLSPACTAKLVPHADAVAFLERSLTAEQATPFQGNTLWHAKWEAAGGAAAEPGHSATVATTTAAAAQAAVALSQEPVLFLGALPKLEGAVPDLPEEYIQACPVLDQGYWFDVNPQMQQNRQALLAGKPP